MMFQSFAAEELVEPRRSAVAASQRYELFKRVFDIVFASTFLLVSFPFLILLAIVLYLDSPGRVIFVQQRLGRDGRMFNCYKFRTMHENAEQLLESILATCEASRREWDADHKLRNDPRISRFGKIARKLSLDELPQLLNILKGEMSVVGPRPIVRAEIPRYGRFIDDYCAVKPGLTGLWQVSGRNDVSYAQRVRLDRIYRRKASLVLDFKILAKTLPVVMLASGSY